MRVNEGANARHEHEYAVWETATCPHTEQLHLVERYRRTDVAHLKVDITAKDPGAFTKPWTIHSVWNLAPGEEIGEYVCAEDNRDAQHLSAK